jgi:hypothetical protein
MLHYPAASRSARIVVTLLHESPGPTTAGASLFAPALACPLTALPVIATQSTDGALRLSSTAHTAWTKRAGRVRCARLEHCKRGTSQQTQGEIDAQNHAHPRAGAGVRRVCGIHRRRANLARSQQHRQRCAEFYLRRTGGVPGMGTLLPAGIHPCLRPLALLVPPLLVIDKREAAATAASFPYRVP